MVPNATVVLDKCNQYKYIHFVKQLYLQNDVVDFINLLPNDTLTS